MKEIKGDLIVLAKQGKFDVIAHGCNCFCRQKSGLAPQMVKAFETNNGMHYPLETEYFKGDIEKLGRLGIGLHLDFGIKAVLATNQINDYITEQQTYRGLFVVNAYTQYEPRASNLYPENRIPLDYNALKMCFTKMNHLFQGLHIGLPHIGCGLAGGNINKVKELINQYFTKCEITLVEYEKE